ncbi:hypothetical protein [Pedobacter sp. Leaf194]|uniref:hypothetical protein n=1 Tax=Pedobacter sp. Leaf194 TaxID=1736297 RepID=UPI000703847C|nr:hypothetical protein [Pedobacter sp. Leaf194]KQS41102.1 hypothetical protein ASG14_01050 [Pedobacter sp. Leaf194]
MKKLFCVFAFLIPLIIHAQTTKTDVLILGNSNAAFAAGVQASQSGASTTILTQRDGFNLTDFKSWPLGGVKQAFEKNARKSSKLADDVALPEFTKQMVNAIIKKWADSSKFLSVINNLQYYEVKRSGNGWELKLTPEKSIKAKVLIVTDNIDKILPSLKIQTLNPSETAKINYAENLYKTTVAGISGSAKFLPLQNLLIENQENMLYIRADNFEIGQTAGVTAAKTVLLKSKTSLSNLKGIQKELLSNKLPLMPFEDVKITDSNWLAIQKIGITGILKAVLKDDKCLFNAEKNVTYDEIKQPLKDYYYKAQIWFDDHQNVHIDLENTISLACYVGNKSVEATKIELQNKWNKSYKFQSKYDLKRILTRREFSVIVNDYLKPFDDVNVDRSGRVIR